MRKYVIVTICIFIGNGILPFSRDQETIICTALGYPERMSEEPLKKERKWLSRKSNAGTLTGTLKKEGEGTADGSSVPAGGASETEKSK
jgi:hypothetical protein